MDGYAKCFLLRTYPKAGVNLAIRRPKEALGQDLGRVSYLAEWMASPEGSENRSWNFQS